MQYIQHHSYKNVFAEALFYVVSIKLQAAYQNNIRNLNRLTKSKNIFLQKHLLEKVSKTYLSINVNAVLFTSNEMLMDNT